MRGTFVAASVLLAFAAGWMLRGCAVERSTQTETTASPQRPIETTPSPVRSARTTLRESSLERGDAPRRDADPKRSNQDAPKLEGVAIAEGAGQPPAKHPNKFTGVVVDSRTGAGLSDVTVHFCATTVDDDGYESGGWTGVGTDADGKFECDGPSDWTDKKSRFEVRVGRAGYRDARVAVTTSGARVELEKLDRAPRPGRIVGTARGEDAKPISGRLFIGLGDELDLHSFGVWTNADANGRFAIDGVAPGHWTVSLAESRASFEVNVAEDGEASVELVGRFENATGAFAAGELTVAAFAREKTRLEMLEFRGGSPDSPDAQSAGYAKQQLELQWLRYAPGRDVVVTGLPSTAGAFVRLERRGGACCEWRAAVVDGAARFASVPLDRWRAALVRPGVEDVRSDDIDVNAGDGPLAVALPTPK